MSQSEVNLMGLEQKFQQKLFVVRAALGQGVGKASLKSGIPERTIRRWKKKFLEFGIEGLKAKSRAAHRVHNRKDVDRVLSNALRELCANEPGLTSLQIFQKLLSVDSKARATLSWIRREKKRLGLTRKRKIKVNTHKTRYEIPEPGFLQIDTKSIEKDGEIGEKLVQFTAIDECTRVRFLSGEMTKGAAAAARFLREAFEFFEKLGVTIKRAQTDHGTEFTIPENEITLASYARGETEDSLFTKECQRLGIKHRLIKKRTPELNGKVERSHRIDEERFYSRFKFSSSSALDHALKNVWMPEYNEYRPHGSLGGMTPMDFLKKKLREIKEQSAQSETKKAA